MNSTTLTTRKAAPFALAFVLAVGGFVFAREFDAASNPPATLKLADPNEAPSRNSFAPVVKKTQPAVVNISSSKVVRSPRGMSELPTDPFFRRFFGEGMEGGSAQPPRERREQSLGSGVIISPEGYILTNNHVVEGATDVRVSLSDKREFKARIVGTDPKTDVAVLKVDTSNLPVVTIADSSKVQVGDFVLALGNPFGVGQTVTMGIVSATGRGNLGIEDYEDFIQTDAPINPGNSGGALVNDRGELVGINTAILSRAGGNQGIGFAIPTNLARQVMDQILKTGKVTRAYLGIVPQDVSPAIAKAFNVKENRGALVGDVTPDGPAERAGIEKGDVIVEVNGKPVNDSNQLRLNVSMMAPDSSATVKLLRNGAERQVNVKLEEYPSNEQRAKMENGEPSGALEGVSVEELDASARRQLNLPSGTGGVVVTEVGPASQAAASGLRQGDVIQEVNRQPVRNAADFERAIGKAGSNPLLLVNRRGNTLYIAV